MLTVAPEPENNAGYDADFFADNDTGGFGDVDDGETFTDAREHFSPGAADRTSIPDGSQSDEFGSLLRARRARPDYVNYAKTAKKVDVKKLKDNLWRKLDLPAVHPSSRIVVDSRVKLRNPPRSLQRLLGVLILCIPRKHLRILVLVSVLFVFCILQMKRD